MRKLPATAEFRSNRRQIDGPESPANGVLGRCTLSLLFFIGVRFGLRAQIRPTHTATDERCALLSVSEIVEASRIMSRILASHKVKSEDEPAAGHLQTHYKDKDKDRARFKKKDDKTCRPPSKQLLGEMHTFALLHILHVGWLYRLEFCLHPAPLFVVSIVECCFFAAQLVKRLHEHNCPSST